MKNLENVSHATLNAHPALALQRKNATDVSKDIYLMIKHAKILAQTANIPISRLALVRLAIKHVLSAKMRFLVFHAIGQDSFFKINASPIAPFLIFKIIIY